MTKEEKSKIIDELSEKFSNNTHFYVTDAGGFTVAQTNAFRRICFQTGVEYRVYKNTLIQKALEKKGGNFEPLYKTLSGFSGVIFSKESGNAPALGATGVQEAIYSILMMKNNFICESANIDEIDPEFADIPIQRARQDNAKIDVVMSNSFGFGGTNGSLIFQRFNG